MLELLDPILDILDDGKFHSIDEIKANCQKLNEKQVEAILNFFDSYGFINKYRTRHPTFSDPLVDGARLPPGMLNFLRRIKELEK